MNSQSENSELPFVIAACDKCLRGYVAYRQTACVYPGCGGAIKAISPVANDFNYGNRWDPMPSHLIRWLEPPQ